MLLNWLLILLVQENKGTISFVICFLLVPQDPFASDFKEQHTSMFVYMCNQLQLTQLTDNNQIVIYSLIIIFEAEKFSFNLLNQTEIYFVKCIERNYFLYNKFVYFRG